MLGFAFSEAQRSEEMMRRLHQQRRHQGEGKTPTTIAGSGKLSSTGSVGSSGGGGHKRRRRRRPKKTGFAGGGGGTSATTDATADLTSALSAVGRGSAMGAAASVGSTRLPTTHNANSTPKPHDAPMTKRDLYFALRCGIVKIGPQVTDTAVGRVTVVNWDNEIVLDTFVKVPVPVTNYRTEVTGITPAALELKRTASLDSVRKKVNSFIRGRILIGHGLEIDLAALRLSHPWCDMRDTASYTPFMQKTLDPVTGMLLPRPLKDLMHHELSPDAIPPEEHNQQPVIVVEAMACIALYKSVREQWETELVNTMQQRHRQREMMLHLRGGGASTAAAAPPCPVLSRIAETDAFGEHDMAVVVPPTPPTTGFMVGHNYYPIDPDRAYSRDLNEYETSTLASDMHTLEGYRDDVSETSSLDGSLRRPRNMEAEMGLHPLFENLHLLPDMGARPTTDHRSANDTFGSSTAPGSGVEEWAYNSGSMATSNHSGFWNPLGTQASSTSGKGSGGGSHHWTQEPSSSGVAMLAVVPPVTNSHQGVHQQPRVNSHVITSDGHHNPHASLSEDEFMGHLPAHLLDDTEVPVVSNNLPEKVNVSEEPKKKSWFGLGRRRRSTSVPSAGEAMFGFFKDASRHSDGSKKLSLSDRQPRQERFHHPAPPGFSTQPK